MEKPDLSDLSTHGINGYKKDGHPTYAPERHGTLYLYLFTLYKQSLLICKQI